MSVQTGPDGTQWVGLHLTSPVQLTAMQMENGEITFMVAMTADVAMTLATDLPPGLQDSARAARTPKLITATALPNNGKMKD